MKNLILIRHAKSSWESPVHDKDRGLTTKGIKDAHNVSSQIGIYLPKTYVMWSSVARRAVDTALIFAQNISYPIESIVYKDDLYTFEEKRLEKLINSCNTAFDSIILFGHNGAITDFVNKFGDIYIDNVPTSGFVSLKFDTDDWKKINKGKTDKTIFPKDLQ